jgi:hypothetical protein
MASADQGGAITVSKELQETRSILETQQDDQKQLG